MKILLLILTILAIDNYSLAKEYTVETNIDGFLIRDKEIILVELTIKPTSHDWVLDASGRSTIFSNECLSSSATIWIHTKVEGTGLKEIGPFHVQIGDEIVKSDTIKVYLFPEFDGSKDLYVMGKRDPNGKDLYQLRIEYKVLQAKGSVGMVELVNETLPDGLELKSGGASHGSETGDCHYTFKVLSNKPIVLDKRNFHGVPDWMAFPEIIIPPKGNP